MNQVKTTKAQFKELIKESLNGMAVAGSSELKQLIKECIREVLSEGQQQPPVSMQPTQQFNPYAQYNPYYAQAMGGWQQQPQMPMQPQPPQYEQAIRTVAGGDPKMQAILNDTARTSLQQTLAFEQNGFTPEQQVQDTSQMARLGMQNVKGRWAQLAFNTQPTISPRGLMG